MRFRCIEKRDGKKAYTVEKKKITSNDIQENLQTDISLVTIVKRLFYFIAKSSVNESITKVVINKSNALKCYCMKLPPTLESSTRSVINVIILQYVKKLHRDAVTLWLQRLSGQAVQNLAISIRQSVNIESMSINCSINTLINEPVPAFKIPSFYLR